VTGDPPRSSSHAESRTAGSHPDPASPDPADRTDCTALLALARAQLAASRGGEAQTTLLRAITVDRSSTPQVLALVAERRREGDLQGAYACVDVLADAALLGGDYDQAAAVLEGFLRDGPHGPTLARLIDVYREAGREAERRGVQAELADLYVADGRGEDARPLAEELLALEPDTEAHVVRLRTVLAMLGVEDIDLVIGLVKAGDPRATLRVVDAAPEPREDAFIGPLVEIDLSDRVDHLASIPGGGAPDVDVVFASLRGAATARQEVTEAAELYDRGLVHLDNGRIAEAVRDLEAAARSPHLRFGAATRLARLHAEQGDLRGSIGWLERAAEIPPPTPEEGQALLYELADGLERLGEPARALAVLVEIESAAPGFRDVAARRARLTGSGPTGGVRP
jgi:tetratricopeptide (TPR) repeat protein